MGNGTANINYIYNLHNNYEVVVPFSRLVSDFQYDLFHNF